MNYFPPIPPRAKDQVRALPDCPCCNGSGLVLPHLVRQYVDPKYDTPDNPQPPIECKNCGAIVHRNFAQGAVLDAVPGLDWGQTCRNIAQAQARVGQAFAGDPAQHMADIRQQVSKFAAKWSKRK